jgi:hypothetical protein
VSRASTEIGNQMRVAISLLFVFVVLLYVAYGVGYYQFWQFKRDVNNERWRDRVISTEIQMLKEQRYNEMKMEEIPEFKLVYPMLTE